MQRHEWHQGGCHPGARGGSHVEKLMKFQKRTQGPHYLSTELAGTKKKNVN